MVILQLTLPGPTLIPRPWNLTGLVPLAFGVWLNLAADKAMHLARTTVKPFEKPASLITSGAFRICRHPMYLGFVSILLGVALLLEGLTPLLVVVAFVILMEVFFIRLEERNLQREFGQSWQEYRHRVRRWI